MLTMAHALPKPVLLTENPFLFNQIPPTPVLRISVVVPVCNEADHLSATLDALRDQTNTVGQPLDNRTYEVLLLLNNCTDASATVASWYQHQHPAFWLHIADIRLPPKQANVGTARRLLMDEACRRLLTVAGPDGIIASTDGDTTVAADWLWQIEQEISRGADAVGGRILTHTNANPSDPIRRWHLRNVTYRCLLAQAEAAIDPCPHDPWPRHFQHFGASLAVTCRAYLQAGRLPAVPYLEDEALYQALLRVDARVRQSPAVRVFTSARTNGRVTVGFSEQLRYWGNLNQTGCEQVVEPAQAMIVKLRARRRLRQYWNVPACAFTADLHRVAADLHLTPRWLTDRLAEYRYFGAVWEQIEQQLLTNNWLADWKPQPITEAIAELRDFLRHEPLRHEPLPYPETDVTPLVSAKQIEPVR